MVLSVTLKDCNHFDVVVVVCCQAERQATVTATPVTLPRSPHSGATGLGVRTYSCPCLEMQERGHLAECWVSSALK
jgi:hypothetical protein